MSRLWLTSDLHFGHTNIIKYTGRPFDDVSAMDEWMIGAWNEMVEPEDEVWVLGDVCMGNIEKSLSKVARLNGTLHLVCGNHDRPFRDASSAQVQWQDRYLQAGFTSVDHGTVRLDLGLERPVSACHFPYEGDSHDGDRYVEHRPMDHGEPLVHGHSHGKWRQHKLMIDVGVDAWGGRPVAGEVVARLIADGPAELTPIPWRRTGGDSDSSQD